MKTIRSKLITNLRWKESVYFIVEFQNIQNSLWIINSVALLDIYDKYNYIADSSNNFVKCRDGVSF